MLWNLGPHLRYFEKKAQFWTIWLNKRQFRHLPEPTTTCHKRSWERSVSEKMSWFVVTEKTYWKRRCFRRLTTTRKSLQVSESWALDSELGLSSVFTATCRTRTEQQVPPESRYFSFLSALKNVWAQFDVITFNSRRKNFSQRFKPTAV